MAVTSKQTVRSTGTGDLCGEWDLVLELKRRISPFEFDSFDQRARRQLISLVDRMLATRKFALYIDEINKLIKVEREKRRAK